MEQIVTTVISVLSALIPAVIYVVGHFKKLDARVAALQQQMALSSSEFLGKLNSGLELLRHKIESLERQLSDQQSHMLKIQDDHTRIAERIAIAETSIEHIEGRIKDSLSARG